MSIIMALMLQATPTISTQELFEIPRQFWGEYNDVLSDCGTGNNDSRLRISWNTIQFYESSGQIEGLIRQFDGSIIVIAQHRGEGQVWQSTYQLRLSADGDALTVIHPQTTEMDQIDSERKRCPARTVDMR